MLRRKTALAVALLSASAMMPAASVAQENAGAPAKGASDKNGGDEIRNLDANTDPQLERPPVDVSNVPSDMDYLFPLTPEERVKIRERQLKDQNATYKPLRNVEPLRELVSISGNADSIPEIHVTPDYPTSVVFTDMTGKPWPIQFIGQTGSLANVVQPEGSENAMVLMAKNGAGKKSVTVFLKDLALPVTLTVSGRNNDYHALKHIRITERGPNSSLDQMASNSSEGSAPNLNPLDSDSEEDGKLDSVLNKLAYKVTPDGYKKLRSSDSRVDAWISKSDDKYMYVRTDYSIVSPSPRAGNRGVTPLQDDVRIYVLPRINPIMALDESGQRQYLTFKE